MISKLLLSLCVCVGVALQASVGAHSVRQRGFSYREAATFSSTSFFRGVLLTIHLSRALVISPSHMEKV